MHRVVLALSVLAQPARGFFVGGASASTILPGPRLRLRGGAENGARAMTSALRSCWVSPVSVSEQVLLTFAQQLYELC